MQTHPTLIVSRCLLGVPCRYNGKAKPCAAVIAYCEDKDYVTVCPECAAELPIPRLPAEQRDGRVINEAGDDLTDAFMCGAKRSLDEALKACGGMPELAILKANSPSCGVGSVYDGSFTGTRVSGNGVFAQLLLEAGVRVITEHELDSV